MERRGAAGAGVFHICYGNTANAVTPEDYFTPDGMLIGKHAPESIGEEGGLNIFLLNLRILQNQINGFMRHISDGSVRILVKPYHPYANDIHIVHNFLFAS
jgi:hypothetical protein